MSTYETAVEIAQRISISPERDQSKLVQRLALLVVGEYGYSADQIMEWIRDDTDRNWSRPPDPAPK